MTTCTFSSGERAPIMLWVGKHRSAYSPTASQESNKRCEVLEVNSIECCVETLARQPVDVLLLEENMLEPAEMGLINEITRCWPYLLCIVLATENGSDMPARLQSSSIPVQVTIDGIDVLDRVCCQFHDNVVH